ncbi:protein mono-ADP-ribosyltransferase PARP12-like [Haliotis cracherodii]|uniref:protein mono-ADP-ribosyltransferase PARP12-like n=1 Tax=Haliotis cracherodii TaxID=6455 RepID=UPI0039E961E8
MSESTNRLHHVGRGRWNGRARGRGRGRVVTYSFAQATIEDESTDVTVQSVRRGLTQGARELCERYNGGPCSCSRLHHQKKAPYVWQYLANTGDWSLLSNTEMEFVERAFCNNEDSTVAEVSWVAPFDKILDPPSKAYNKYSFRRLSTRSYVDAGSDAISRYTQWVWYWKDNDGEWAPFVPPELQLTLETKYLAGQDIYLYSIGDQEYHLDFTSLVQVNRKYQTRRPVHRRPVFVSLDDARHRQQTCSSLLMSPAAVMTSCVPANWTPLDCYQESEMVDLASSSDEYSTVMASINKTLSSNKCKVKHVYRLQNALLLHNYSSMKKTLHMSHGTDTIDERQLFHGTDTRDVVNNICINNFDFRVSGKNATKYGKGAYFARDAKYSHSYTKGRDRYMFLARVLVGKYTLGDSTYTRPPPRKGHVLHDSCVNDEKNPSIFVIFERNQCYPEYLVEYRDGTVDESSSVNRQYSGSAPSPASAPVQNINRAITVQSIPTAPPRPKRPAVVMPASTSYSSNNQHQDNSGLIFTGNTSTHSQAYQRTLPAASASSNSNNQHQISLGLSSTSDTSTHSQAYQRTSPPALASSNSNNQHQISFGLISTSDTSTHSQAYQRTSPPASASSNSNNQHQISFGLISTSDTSTHSQAYQRTSPPASASSNSNNQHQISFGLSSTSDTSTHSQAYQRTSPPASASSNSNNQHQISFGLSSASDTSTRSQAYQRTSPAASASSNSNNQHQISLGLSSTSDTSTHSQAYQRTSPENSRSTINIDTLTRAPVKRPTKLLGDDDIRAAVTAAYRYTSASQERPIPQTSLNAKKNICKIM